MQRPPVRPALRRLTVLAALVALGGLSGHTPTLAHAATLTVTDCTSNTQLNTDIATAIAGDTITFACSGTITDNLTISQNLTLDATGQQVTLDGGGAGSVITVLAAQLTLTALTITHGSNGYSGGGIYNDGTLTLTNSTVSGNTTAGVGGFGGIGGGQGGGIYNLGTLTLTNSTVSGNTSTANAGGGGGIYNDYGSTVTLTNSTVSGNTSIGITSGGGIFNGGTVTLTNSTVSGNTAAGGLGGGGIYNEGTVTLRNTILAGNSAPSGPDCFGGLTSGGYNLLGNNSACAGLTNGANGDQVGGTDPSGSGAVIDPKLGPLAPNGGPTQTMALQPGSPAIGAGDAATCESLVGPTGVTDTDQRGQPRNAAARGACDLGAYDTGVAPYAFGGFLAPVANAPALTVVKAGAAVSINFSLGGDRGLGILAAGSPASQQVACASGTPTNAVAPTTTAGNSGLSYDPSTQTYTYVWKTSKGWAGTCRAFVLTLADGSTHTATFQFT